VEGLSPSIASVLGRYRVLGELEAQLAAQRQGLAARKAHLVGVLQSRLRSDRFKTFIPNECAVTW
jgi:hypothetical protein